MSNDKSSSTIELKVTLDHTKMPAKIEWKSENQENPDKYTECKAFILSLFEKEHKDTLRIDLWTKDFQVGEMDRFVYNTLKGLADTYVRATKNTQLGNDMQKFTQFFGEQTKILDVEE